MSLLRSGQSPAIDMEAPAAAPGESDRRAMRAAPPRGAAGEARRPAPPLRPSIRPTPPAAEPAAPACLPHLGAIPWGAVEALRPAWVRRAVRAGIDREDAEDLFQESLLAALEGIERLRIPQDRCFADAFLAWFWGILRHKQISEIRRRRRVRPLGDEPLEAGAVQSRAQGREALAMQVRSSLGLLAHSAPEEAEVLRERFMRGRELQELATALGVSVPTACRRVQAALARLRGCMALVLS